MIEDEEKEPFVIESTMWPNNETVALCLLGKLWTERSYNVFGLMETMKKLWNPTKGMICRDMGNQMISFQFNSKRDMDRVLAMEPWHFNKHVLVLKQITEDIQPSSMEFNSTPFWMRIYDLPMSGKEENTLKQIGVRFGKVMEVDKESMEGVSRSIQIRIILRLNNPMKQGTKIKIGKVEPCWLSVTYERLPSFCYYCGKLGHTYKYCGIMHEQEENADKMGEERLPYGDWMRSSPRKAIQVRSEKEGESRDSLRRSLFRQKNIIEENNDKDERSKHEDTRE